MIEKKQDISNDETMAEETEIPTPKPAAIVP